MKTPHPALLLGLCLAPSFTLAQETPRTSPSSVVVSAESWASSPPERFRLSMSFVASGASSEDALNGAKKKRDAAAGVLKTILAGDFTFFDRDIRFQPSSKGSASTQVEILSAVESSDLAHLGKLLDASATLGSTSVSDLKLYPSEESSERAQAVGRATASCRKKAEAAATALGKKIGRLVELQHSDEAEGLTIRNKRMEGEDPLASSDSSTRVSVTARFEVLP